VSDDQVLRALFPGLRERVLAGASFSGWLEPYGDRPAIGYDRRIFRWPRVVARWEAKHQKEAA
jgi:hypothetical protein